MNCMLGLDALYPLALIKANPYLLIQVKLMVNDIILFIIQCD
jgi:hypothetical protein